MPIPSENVRAPDEDGTTEWSPTINVSISPPLSYLLNSSTRPTPVLHSKFSRTHYQMPKKRGFSSRDGPVSRKSYSPTPGMEETTEPATPKYLHETGNTGTIIGHENYVEQCFSPLVKEAEAFQGLSIHSPVISNSPLSSFSSYTPGRMGRIIRPSETFYSNPSPSCASPAHRQVPLTVISSSSYDNSIPLSTPLGKASTNSNGNDCFDYVNTPVDTIKDIYQLYSDGRLCSLTTKQDLSLSSSSHFSPNRLLSPSGRRGMSDFILSPRSSQQKLKDEPYIPQHKNNFQLSMSATGTMNYGLENIETDMNAECLKEKLAPLKSWIFIGDSIASKDPLTKDQNLALLSDDFGIESLDEGAPPVRVVSLLGSSKTSEKTSDMFSADNFASSKSLFNQPSNRSFEKLEKCFYDDTNDSDTQDILSDTDEAELDSSAFILGTPTNGHIHKQKTAAARVSKEGFDFEFGGWKPDKSTIASSENSFLNYGFNSETSLDNLNSETDLYGLHVIYEGYASQNSMENLLGSVKFKRSRVMSCEERLEMNRTQSNNSMGSLGLSIDEVQGLCHVNSARDLITPPVAQQERLSPPPIKETNLTWKKY